MDLDQLTEELTCPLTLSLLSDPVTLPCCGKAVSRSPLRSALATSNRCPLCRREVPLDLVENAPRNRVVQALLDALATSTATEPTSTVMMNSEDEAPELTATYCLLPVPTKSTDTALSLQRSESDASIKSVSRIGRLQLKVTNTAALNLRRNLSILVVDKSGSMAGSPWNQASLAMKHIVSMAHELSHFSVNTTLKIVCYDSRASELSCQGSVDQVHARIDSTRAGGSTSFRAAFQETLRVMRQTVANAKAIIEQGQVPEGTVSPMPGVVQILFLTDGQAHEDRTLLADELARQVVKFRADFAHDIGGVSAVPDVTVHAVGFSRDCDRTLLDRIRNAGTHPGQFRYCEPGDSEDALCGRLTGMFESMAAHGGCELLVERLVLPLASGHDEEATEQQLVPQPTWEFLGHDGKILPPSEKGRVRLQLRTRPDGVGTAVAWFSINAPKPASALVLPVAVTCNAGQERPPVEEEAKESNDSPREHDLVGNCPLQSLHPDFTITASEDPSLFSSTDAVKRAWVGVRLHVIAEDAIACASAATNKDFPLAEQAVRLWGAFLEHRLREVSALGSDAHGRVPGLLEQLRGLSNWKKASCVTEVSIGRLRDLSSASAFSSSRPPVANSAVATQRSQGASVFAARQPSGGGRLQQMTATVANGESVVFYNGNNEAMKRNLLQSAIMNWGQHNS